MFIRLKIVFLVVISLSLDCRAKSLQASQPKVAVTIHANNLSIFGQDTLMIFSDLYLLNATVGGDGVLALKGNAAQRIYSEHSSLPHLCLQNVDTVHLYGNLCIQQQLTIVNGIMDAREGNIQLHDTSLVQLLGNAQLLLPDEVQSVDPPPNYSLIFTLLHSGNKAIVLWANRHQNKLMGRPPKLPHFIYRLWSNHWIAVPSPPPELEYVYAASLTFFFS